MCFKTKSRAQQIYVYGILSKHNLTKDVEINHHKYEALQNNN